MFAHDKLEVINNALMTIGLPLAASLEDCDWNASTVYDLVVEQILRSFNWGFAGVFTVITQSGGMPAHGFRSSYAMPADCLRVIDVRCNFDLRSPKARFVISGRDIFANVSPCNLRYVRLMLDPQDWPPDFTDAVSCRIAFEIASLSAQTMSMTPGLMQLYQLSLTQAQSVDATETTERVPLDESVLIARAGGRA